MTLLLYILQQFGILTNIQILITSIVVIVLVTIVMRRS